MLKFWNIFDITEENREIKYDLLGIDESKDEITIAPL